MVRGLGASRCHRQGASRFHSARLRTHQTSDSPGFGLTSGRHGSRRGCRYRICIPIVGKIFEHRDCGGIQKSHRTTPKRCLKSIQRNPTSRHADFIFDPGMAEMIRTAPFCGEGIGASLDDAVEPRVEKSRKRELTIGCPEAFGRHGDAGRGAGRGTRDTNRDWCGRAGSTTLTVEPRKALGHPGDFSKLRTKRPHYRLHWPVFAALAKNCVGGFDDKVGLRDFPDRTDDSARRV